MRTIALCLILAGCATTGAEVKEQGTKMSMQSSNSPSVAANCIARNVDNIGYFGLHTAVRETAIGYEVEVRAGLLTRTLVVYGETRTEKSGSLVTLWLNLIGGDPAKAFANMTKGC